MSTGPLYPPMPDPFAQMRADVHALISQIIAEVEAKAGADMQKARNALNAFVAAGKANPNTVQPGVTPQPTTGTPVTPAGKTIATK